VSSSDHNAGGTSHIHQRRQTIPRAHAHTTLPPRIIIDSKHTLTPPCLPPSLTSRLAPTTRPAQPHQKTLSINRASNAADHADVDVRRRARPGGPRARRRPQHGRAPQLAGRQGDARARQARGRVERQPRVGQAADRGRPGGGQPHQAGEGAPGESRGPLFDCCPRGGVGFARRRRRLAVVADAGRGPWPRRRARAPLAAAFAFADLLFGAASSFLSVQGRKRNAHPSTIVALFSLSHLILSPPHDQQDTNARPPPSPAPKNAAPGPPPRPKSKKQQPTKRSAASSSSPRRTSPAAPSCRPSAPA